MNLSNVTVEEVGSKSVTTKFGPKPTYSFKANGEWFRTGFKNLRLNSGDNISFDYTESKYGKEVESVTHNTSGAAGPTTAAIPVPPRAPFPAAGKGVFPIPALDGQRAIVRQNSITNAVKFIGDNNVLLSGGRLPEQWTVDEAAEVTIALARKFEAYSCGDLDLAEVVAERNVKT